MLSIGHVAARTGLAVSASRFYEEKGLVQSERNAGGQRRFRRADIRRLSFILIAQQLGFALAEIKELLADLPIERAPDAADWARLSTRMATALDARIAGLVALRDRLDGCIGCGCLSLEKCALYNPDDGAAALGQGPRYLLGNRAVEVTGR